MSTTSNFDWKFKTKPVSKKEDEHEDDEEEEVDDDEESDIQESAQPKPTWRWKRWLFGAVLIILIIVGVRLLRKYRKGENGENSENVEKGENSKNGGKESAIVKINTRYKSPKLRFRV